MQLLEHLQKLGLVEIFSDPNFCGEKDQTLLRSLEYPEENQAETPLDGIMLVPIPGLVSEPRNQFLHSPNIVQISQRDFFFIAEIKQARVDPTQLSEKTKLLTHFSRSLPVLSKGKV